MNKLHLTLGAIALTGLAAFGLGSIAVGGQGYAPGVTSDGTISVPDVDFRKDWALLGSWIVNDEGKTAKGVHQVYTQKSTVEAYRKTGKFPDGAVLVKELFGTKTEEMTTGTISRADNIEGWFVMVKDTKSRFPENKLWGDGWGWAFFKGDDRLKTTSTDYVADCKSCHVPVQDKDWIYTDGYKVLEK